MEEQQKPESPASGAPITGEEEFVSPEATEPTPHEEMRYLGPIVAILIVVLVLILGGLYMWGMTLTREPDAAPEPRQIENNEPETVRAEADAQILNTVSSSDEIDAIDADLESTDLDSLDAELNTIDQELEAALQ